MKKILVENKIGPAKRKKSKEPTKDEQIKDMEDWMEGMAKSNE